MFIIENSKGNRYFLHRKVVVLRNNRKQTIHYFARRPDKPNLAPSLPEGWEVVESMNGLPIARKVRQPAAG